MINTLPIDFYHQLCLNICDPYAACWVTLKVDVGVWSEFLKSMIQCSNHVREQLENS